MILNPSHEITLKGLPSEILDAYVRYKKGSRAIVSWLLQFGPNQYHGIKTLPIKELAALARAVTEKIDELPEVVHFYFRETIAARKRLSEFFRKSVDNSADDAGTINHEHFTASLTKIYLDLCKCQCNNTGRKRKVLGILRNDRFTNTAQNHFAHLPIEELSDEDTSRREKPENSEHNHLPFLSCPGSQTEVDIENDETGQAIETASLLEHIHDVFVAVEDCWRRSGEGSIHFVSSTVATNVAWSKLRDLAGRLRELDAAATLDCLHQRTCLLQTASKESQPPSNIRTLLESLKAPDHTIAHYAHCEKLLVTAHCTSCVQKPTDYISVDDKQNSDIFASAITNNVLGLMCKSGLPMIILQSSPVFAEIGYVLTHREDKSTTFQCALALHLILASCKTYLKSSEQPNKSPACRITSLKLSAQASSTLSKLLEDEDSFPCYCPQTLAFHLSKLKDDLEAYSRYKCWDLYFQSPWVAGNHMIEMLDMLSYYGMRLFHYRHYIGAILHSYNVLVELAGLERIAILEDVTETFKSVIFPSGKRPVEHFKNNWARYIGARLRFKKGHKRHANERDSWCMAVPAHAARNAAGLSVQTCTERSDKLEAKFDYGQIDPVMKLKSADWRDDSCGDHQARSAAKHGDHWNKTLSSPPSLPSNPTASPDIISNPSTPFEATQTGKKGDISTSSTSSPTPSSAPLGEKQDPYRQERQHEHEHEQEHNPLHQILHNVNSSLHPRYHHHYQPSSPPLPTTNLNHISIYMTLVNIITKITSQIHAHDDSSSSTSTTTTPNNNNNKPKNCICFVHTILSAGDRIVEGRRYGGVGSAKGKGKGKVVECWRKEERVVVDVVKRCLVEGMEEIEKDRGVWFWDL